MYDINYMFIYVNVIYIFHLIFMRNHEESTVIIIVLQMRNWRHREIKSLTKVIANIRLVQMSWRFFALLFKMAKTAITLAPPDNYRARLEPRQSGFRASVLHPMLEPHNKGWCVLASFKKCWPRSITPIFWPVYGLWAMVCGNWSELWKECSSPPRESGRVSQGGDTCVGAWRMTWNLADEEEEGQNNSWRTIVYQSAKYEQAWRPGV